eukprot:2064686-Pleurochrysis_carterae.AAC.1
MGSRTGGYKSYEYKYYTCGISCWTLHAVLRRDCAAGGLQLTDDPRRVAVNEQGPTQDPARQQRVQREGPEQVREWFEKTVVSSSEEQLGRH